MNIEEMERENEAKRLCKAKLNSNENEGENSIHSGYKHQYLRENVIRHAMYREENYKILVKTVKYELSEKAIYNSFRDRKA